MSTLNINRDLTDIFYRYKMPRITVKIEGKGNGIKTVITNMAEIAKIINRSPIYPIKYFAYELGIQTQFDTKVCFTTNLLINITVQIHLLFQNKRFILNGYHDAYKLQDLLACFIREYVLCLRCDNPETDLSVPRKRSVIYQNCRACGFYDILKSVHKVTNFIIKNPPELRPSPLRPLPTRRKCTDRTKNSESANTILNMPSYLSISLENKYEPNQGTESDIIWISDVSEDAVLERMSDLTKGGFASKLLQSV